MKKLSLDEIAIIRRDAACGVGFSGLAWEYGITWTELLGIVDHCSHKTPLNPPMNTQLEKHVAHLDKQIATLEKKVRNLEAAEQERRSDWEQEYSE